MTVLSSLPAASIDPIFLVAEEARRAGAGAINASIGMMLDKHGKPFLLPSVRSAAERWATFVDREGFPYPPLLGLPAFRTSVTKLIFGSGTSIASIASAGGTGALALNLKLLALLGYRTVVVPSPSWPNHQRLVHAYGFRDTPAPFLEEGAPSVLPLLALLQKVDEPVALLLQVSGHNPTGLQWSREQWQELASALAGTKHAVLLDCAYQGLGEGVEEDVASVRILREQGVSLLVSWSASKNHSIYGLRTGLACVVASSEAEKAEAERHYQIFAREMHSAAPTAGQYIVADVQEHRADAWRQELASLRDGLRKRRQVLAEAFPAWRRALEGQGLFAQLPLSSDAVRSLRTEKVFLTEDCRVNLAGIPLERLADFAKAVRCVVPA